MAARKAPTPVRLTLALEARIADLSQREGITFSAALRIAASIGLQMLEQARSMPAPQMIAQVNGKPETPPTTPQRRRMLSRGVD